MNKIIKSLFVFSITIFSLSVFAASSQKSLLDTISEEKAKVETMFDTSYTNVYKDFQFSVSGFIYSLDYQGLVCLGVIDDSLFLKQMQDDSKNLKIGFLNAYSNLYADASDLEQKQRIFKDTSVSLFSGGVDYETEKKRILDSIYKLSEDQKVLFDQFQISYKNKTVQFVKDFNDYSKKNKDLLASVSTYIKTVNLVEQSYKSLTSDLLKYQIQLAGSGNNFFSKLYMLKQSSLSGLDITFQNMIDKEVKRYKILPDLGNQLKEQKSYALGLYELQFDEKINVLLDKWYDNKEFTQITQQVKQFSSDYKPSGKLQCSSVVSSSTFMDKSSNLLSKIKLFNNNFSLNNSGSINSSQFQDALSKWYPIIIQLQKDITATFSKAIVQKRQGLFDGHKQQIIVTGSQASNPIDTSSSTPVYVSDSFKFTKAFKKGQSNADIKILQQLLTRLGYYKGSIDGIYGPKTIESVYKYQLDKGLLVGYEKKPQTWGWMGPSTRNMLNNDLLK